LRKVPELEKKKQPRQNMARRSVHKELAQPEKLT